MNEELIFNTVKDYPDMIKIVIYRQPLKLSAGSSRKHRKRSPDAEPSQRSVLRTRATIEDLCLCNEFDLFVTFTFDPKRYNSKSFISVQRYIHNWLRNARTRHSKHLEYLIVPEQHKSGAYHLHALLKNYEGELKDSKVRQNNRKVYNITNWMFGFSTAVYIDNQEAVSRYIRKYITKDMICFSSKKRYLCSQGLKRPTRSHNIRIPSTLKQINLTHTKDDNCDYITIYKNELAKLHPFKYN